MRFDAEPTVACHEWLEGCWKRFGRVLAEIRMLGEESVNDLVVLLAYERAGRVNQEAASTNVRCCGGENALLVGACRNDVLGPPAPANLRVLA